MAINKLTLPYSSFNIGSVIDPDEFNANNSAIVTVVNNLVESANMPPVVDEDGDIILPDYIKETYIDGAELRSPTITGNTFIGSTGQVGMSALGTANTSVRIWAGGHANNKEEAPFRVLQNGEVRMGGTSTNPMMKITPSGHLKIGSQVTSPQYGTRHMFEWDGEDIYLGTLVFRRAHFGANASDGSWWNLNTTDRPGENFINLYAGPSNLVYTVSHSGDVTSKGSITSSDYKAIGSLNLEPGVGGSGSIYAKGGLSPHVNNTYNLGGDTLRWKNIYVATGGINESSDMRHKTNISDIPYDLLKHFANEVKPKVFDSNGKTHFGYIAQDIERALYKYATNKVGHKDAKRYVDEFNVLGKDGSYLSLVYSQISVIKEAELQNKVDELSNVVQELNNKIDSLK